jgi:hypothetical protein
MFWQAGSHEKRVMQNALATPNLKQVINLAHGNCRVCQNTGKP